MGNGCWQLAFSKHKETGMGTAVLCSSSFYGRLSRLGFHVSWALTSPFSPEGDSVPSSPAAGWAHWQHFNWAAPAQLAGRRQLCEWPGAKASQAPSSSPAADQTGNWANWATANTHMLLGQELKYLNDLQLPSWTRADKCQSLREYKLIYKTPVQALMQFLSFQ